MRTSDLLLAAAAVVALIDHHELRAEPAKMTIADCQAVLVGLNGLDGRAEMTKDGAAVTVPYQFGNGALRLAIQQNIAALNGVQQAFVKVQQDLFREIAGSATEIKPNTLEFAKYQKAVMDAQASPCDVTLVRIKASDLKLDKNEIPGSVLGALDRILDR